jgi:hypothetical protein
MNRHSLHDRDVVQAKTQTFTLPPGVRFPHELVSHPDLTTDEKRRLLAAWASDASSVEGLPTLRMLPGTKFPVMFSAVMDALDQLDREAPASVAFGGGRSKGGNDASP